MSETSYWVYILYCNNDTYYTGYTTDITRRLQQHIAGDASCKYTRSFKPLALMQSWKTVENKSTAMKMECHIKSLNKLEKTRLISSPEVLCELFSCEVVKN